MLKAFPKVLGLVLVAATLSSCGLFSSDKELPVGTRRPVLATESTNFQTSSEQINALKIPLPVNTRNWEQTGMSATHEGFNFAARKNLQRIWKKSFGNGSSKRNRLLTAPIITNGKVFVQDASGVVSAFNLEDGKKLWVRKLRSKLSDENDTALNGMGLAAHQNKILAVAGFGTLFALDADTGDILWKYNAKTPLRSAPTVCANRAYVRTLDNLLLAFNIEDGTLSWRYNISAEDTVWAGAAAPACRADKNLLVAGFANGDLEAFNASIGYPLWQATLVDNTSTGFSTDINAIQAPAVIDKDMVYATGAELTMGIDIRTGEQKWQQKMASANIPLVTGDYVFIVTDSYQLTALNKKTGNRIWTIDLPRNDDTKLEKIYATGPLMINGHLFVGTSEGDVFAFSAQNGKLLYQIDLGDGIASAPIFAEGYVVFVTTDANLVVYR